MSIFWRNEERVWERRGRGGSLVRAWSVALGSCGGSPGPWAVASGGVGREHSSGHRSEQQSKRKSVRESSKSFCFHSAKIKCFHVVGRKKSEKKRRQNFGTFCMSGWHLGHQARILYPMNLSFRSEGEIKTFSNKHWRNLTSVYLPALQEMLKSHREGKSHRSETEIKLIDTVNQEIEKDAVLSGNVSLGQGSTNFCLSTCFVFIYFNSVKTSPTCLFFSPQWFKNVIS